MKMQCVGIDIERISLGIEGVLVCKEYVDRYRRCSCRSRMCSHVKNISIDKYFDRYRRCSCRSRMCSHVKNILIDQYFDRYRICSCRSRTWYRMSCDRRRTCS